MRGVALCVSVLLLAGCSSGLKEVAFMDQGRYVVSRSLVNDRFTANQPHPSGTFICRSKISSEDMAELRKDGNDHSGYFDCQLASEYVATSDQSILTQASGPLEAVAIGAGVGAGLAFSGDTNNLRQGQSQRQSQKQKAGKKRR